MRVSSYLLQDKGNHPRNQSNQPFLQDPQGTKKKVVSGLGANNNIADSTLFIQSVRFNNIFVALQIYLKPLWSL